MNAHQRKKAAKRALAKLVNGELHHVPEFLPKYVAFMAEHKRVKLVSDLLALGSRRANSTDLHATIGALRQVEESALAFIVAEVGSFPPVHNLPERVTLFLLSEDFRSTLRQKREAVLSSAERAACGQLTT